MKRRSNDKADLPQKVCVACGRPFTWRKKWAKDWEQVRYCSNACRRSRGGATASRPYSAPRTRHRDPSGVATNGSSEER